MGVDATTTNIITEQRNITQFNLLALAKKQYGEEVIIQNVGWDVKIKRIFQPFLI